ncbi:MAG: tetratricopeptide repeat protein [Clostridium sp.]
MGKFNNTVGKKESWIKRKFNKYRDGYKKACEKNNRLESIVPIILTCSFAFIVMFSAKLATTEDTVSIATNKAEEAFYNGDYDTAIVEYQKLQGDEAWPIWEVKLAEVHSLKGEFVKSNNLLADAYEKRVKLIERDGYGKYAEKDMELASDIVFISLMNNNMEKALEYGEIMLGDNYANKKLYRTMVPVYVLNNRTEDAKKIIDKYPIDEKSAYDMSIAAYLNIMVNEWDEGLEVLKDAWHKDMDEIKVFDVIAQISAYDNDLVLQKITKLSEKNPDELAYKMWLAKIYSMREESAPQAEEILKSLEGKEIGKVNHKIIEAKVLQNTGRQEESTKLLEEIIKDEKKSFLGYHVAAWNAFEKEDYSKAFEYCQKSILENKEYADNYGFLIPEIMIKQKQDKIAEPYLRTAISIEPYNYNIMLKIADYYWYTTQDGEKAFNYFNMASKLKPNDAEIFYNMALVQISRGKVDEAEAYLKQAIKINGSNTKYYRTLGTFYLNNGKEQQGIEAIRNAYAVDSSDILTLNNAGIYYISIEGDVNRGYVNLKSAYDGITDSTDKETKDTITSNYTKAKELYDAYMQNNGAQLQVPNFTLFY